MKGKTTRRKRKGERTVDLQRTVEILNETKARQRKAVALISEALCPEPRKMRIGEGDRRRHEQNQRDLKIKQQHIQNSQAQ